MGENRKRTSKLLVPFLKEAIYFTLLEISGEGSGFAGKSWRP